MRVSWIVGALAALACMPTGGDAETADKGGKQAQLLKYAEQRAENAEKELERVKAQNAQVVGVCETATERHETALKEERSKLKSMVEKNNSAQEATRALEKKLFEQEKSLQEQVEARVAEVKASFEQALRRATGGTNGNTHGQSHIGALVRAPVNLMSAVAAKITASPCKKQLCEASTSAWRTVRDAAAGASSKAAAFMGEKMPDQVAVKGMEYWTALRDGAGPHVASWIALGADVTTGAWEKAKVGATQVRETATEMYATIEEEANKRIDFALVEMGLDQELPPTFADRMAVAFLVLLGLIFAITVSFINMRCMCRTLCGKNRDKAATGKKDTQHFHACSKHRKNQGNSKAPGSPGAPGSVGSAGSSRG